MNDCLGCAGLPPDDGFISFIMRLIDNPLGIPLIIMSTLVLLLLLNQVFKLSHNLLKREKKNDDD